jgi:hypothetical protein
MPRSSLQRSRASSSELFAAQMTAWRERMRSALEARLPPAGAIPVHLNAALRSWVLGRDERKHPILMFAVARTVGLREQQVEAAACALELLHLFVEVHRILPALAQAEPASAADPALQTYDEAMLLLVGDSLPPLAFDLISVGPGLPRAAEVRLQLASILAAASGTRGALGGQPESAVTPAGSASVDGDQAAHADRAHYRAGVRMAIACRSRPPGKNVSALLAEFERAMSVSWAEAYAVLPRSGAQAEALRWVTRWLAEREGDGGTS